MPCCSAESLDLFEKFVIFDGRYHSCSAGHTEHIAGSDLLQGFETAETQAVGFDRFAIH